MRELYYNSLISFLVLVILIGMCQVMCVEAGWIIEIVDDDYRVYGHCSLALDSNEIPNVAYKADFDRSLIYARQTELGWQKTIRFHWSGMGDYCSLAFNNAGIAGIAHRDVYDQDLHYSWYDGSNWQTDSVDPSFNTGGYTSLVFDSADLPHISYTDFGANRLMYTYKYLGSWNTVEVGTGGYYTDLVLSEADGYPHLCSMWPQTLNESSLYYRWRSFSGWHSETITLLENGGLGAKIALDDADNPMIVTSDGINGGLYLLRRSSGGLWSVETIDPNPYITGNISMAIDSNHFPHISYYDAEYGRLKYARWTGTQWVHEIVDADGVLGSESSLVLDNNDTPHVAYYDSGRHQLRYAKWIPGSSWYNLIMVDTELQEGDSFYVTARGGNASTTTLIVDEYILLEAFGSIFFYPGWSDTLDFQTLTLNPGQSFERSLFSFSWPSGIGAASGLVFHAALFTASTFDLLAYDFVEWEYF